MSDLEEARNEAAALRGMMKDEGWGYFKTFIEVNTATRRMQVMYEPLSSLDAALAQEFMKGEVAGQDSILAGIEARLEELEAVITAKDKERNNGAEEEG